MTNRIEKYFTQGKSGKSGKHLCQAKRIRCGMNAHNHEILSTEDFPSYIQANHIFYG